MADLIGSIWWLAVSLGLLVTFHEYGHYWVARRCGVDVLRFSIGFGRPLWSRRNRAGTEFAIAAIPLGGYVKMLDEREADVPAHRQAHAFNRQNVWRRIAIVVAGPAANLLLCVALLWAMFIVGRQDYAPVVGRSAGIAAEAGFQPGDRLVEIAGRPVATWTEVAMAMAAPALDRRDIQVRSEDAAGREAVRTLRLSRLPAGLDERRIPEQAGFAWRFLLAPALVDSVREDAAAAGVLLPGDLILAIDGQRVDAADRVAPLVQALGERGGEGMVEVERAGERLALELRPRPSTDPRRAGTWELGIAMSAPQAPEYDAVQRFGPVAAIPAALRETGRLASDSLGMIRRMLTGDASVRDNLSGPVTIARAANASAKRGADWFLYFLALLSLSLAIINLLPIPILDGGHLLYYLIELVKGSPLSERAMAAGQYVGLALLAGLMGLAFYNDILGLLPR
ncbi:RIP metalloprotease RseP [Pseudoxanthomonas broegbernensis]|uniref:Zinc metalloprotease n=1 Tax=Pseudoxanthomonas broegbernensis TaxID=83619 RepID=A0A7V8GMA7_9GAMM|nr:RIP metalloprotease RseP [Pseudoxanthomonas broegbernensis]KAF1686290.1 RIP metalloprotease RseP [Pseudoxanthomonas broegbernensis]MBB6063974.1 regulator of sigma E protease [Pseudoxanthomonas broegbernensis]